MGNDIFNFSIGNFNCIAISDHDLNFSLNILLVDTGQHHVLIDTGLGDTCLPVGQLFPGSHPPLGLLMERLRSLHISPMDIDVVVQTHADFDHIGGAVDSSGKPAFPNAGYVLSQREWDFWESKPVRCRPDVEIGIEFRQLIEDVAHKRLAQLHNVLKLVDPNAEVVPGIRLMAAPGHTPGYSVVQISSEGEQLLYLGDLIREEKELENPTWTSKWDFDPAQVVITQQKLLTQANKEKMLLMSAHMPFPGLGYISREEPLWKWKSLIKT